ncbi:MAG: 5-formyltetrahydrofolate cyclo-ligase [Peptoniphilaceae bacterium]|nr:5-formyltetrahydrofolate cyclo-ligase [Peptoniphilaceae bacterium]MDY6085895.1 5-formyltetrahydrofolate cyclo-ligase [Peptoniphilaceae bacterium]
MSPKEEKKHIRKDLKKRLKEMTPLEKARADARIVALIRKSDAYQNAASVFCFVSMPEEVDTHPLLDSILKEGKTLVVPRITGPGQMDLVPLERLDAMTPDRFGILEPAADLPTIEKDAIDLAIVPCLGATRDGRRLGRGGGFYDRFLRDYKGEALLVVYEAMLIEDVPMEPWDVALPHVVTEKGVFPQCPAAR